MRRRRLIAPLASLAVCVVALASAGAVAQTAMTEPPPPPAAPPPAAPPPPPAELLETPIRPSFPRPRMSTAIGMGATFDSAGFVDGNKHLIPAFFTGLGVGDGRFGFELGVYASQASGRFTGQDPIDRLAIDAFAVGRLGAIWAPDNQRYATRVLRTVGLELGPSFEREGRSMVSGTRFAIRTGARVELPLTPIRELTELRVRLAVRRAFGLYTPKLYGNAASDVTEVDDSAVELYTALVVIF